MDDLKSFAINGAKILESTSGDLRGDGSKGYVVVTDLGGTASRDVKILVPDASGNIREASSNARLVPCATCGGVAGDPYGFTRIERGGFTVAIGGGSRERWSDENTFTYVPARSDWFVSHVLRRVQDLDTGQHKEIDLRARDLGDVAFSDFDPSRLPEVTLP